MAVDKMMKMTEIKQDTKMTPTSKSLETVKRTLYSNELEGLEDSGYSCAYRNFKHAKNRIRERGITLIALVVTVIVLLILARSNNNSDNGR